MDILVLPLKAEPPLWVNQCASDVQRHIISMSMHVAKLVGARKKRNVGRVHCRRRVDYAALLASLGHSIVANSAHGRWVCCNCPAGAPRRKLTQWVLEGAWMGAGVNLIASKRNAYQWPIAAGGCEGSAAISNSRLRVGAAVLHDSHRFAGHRGLVWCWNCGSCQLPPQASF